MSEITRGEIVRVAVDLAKRVIQVHAVDAGGRVVVARALSVCGPPQTGIDSQTILAK